ncbi:MAG TPA: hypothetical protein VIL66_06360 [Bacillota bacterium]
MVESIIVTVAVFIIFTVFGLISRQAEKTLDRMAIESRQESVNKKARS